MTILAAVVSLLTFVQPQPTASDSLTLQSCYNLARQRYPIAKKIELEQKITDLNTSIANTRYFPQLKINGQASYQSEVTSFAMQGPTLSKDQYKVGVDVSQSIFSGGAIGIRKRLEQSKGEQAVDVVRVDLHKIREQVNQVFFSILLSQKQSETVQLLTDNLQKQLNTVRSRVKNGTLLPSQQHILEAELIKARQDSADIRSNIRAGYEVLGELIDQKIPSGTELALPETVASVEGEAGLHRPEYKLFESSKNILEVQKKLIQSEKYPTLAAFGSVNYGRPGYNFLKDDFHDFYMVGLKLSWDFWDWSNASEKVKALTIQQQTVDQNQAAFSKQVQASVYRIREQITSLQEKMWRDREIIDLRRQVVNESASQLRNGVITATEYVTVLTNANQARLALEIHKVQLRQAQIDLATTLGLTIE